MKIHGTTYISWGLLALAILAWAAVGLFAWTIQGDESAQAIDIQATQQSSTAQTSEIRMHALAQDTASNRSALSALLNVNIVSIVNMIQASGKANGVDAKVSNALPETLPFNTSGPNAIGAVGFTVEATGIFSALIHVAQLLETLPIPSSLDELDIQETPSLTGTPATGEWQMNASVNVLTTSIPSS